MSLMDQYFKRPVIWDYSIGLVSVFISMKLIKSNIISYPSITDSLSLTTDLTNITLTLSGFVLTILTILISYKSSINLKRKDINSNLTSFDYFFASDYYYQTVHHLKNCIKSILIISTFGFSLKLFLPENIKIYTYYFNILGLIVTILTIWRCLLILNKVISLQQNEKNKSS